MLVSLHAWLLHAQENLRHLQTAKALVGCAFRKQWAYQDTATIEMACRAAGAGLFAGDVATAMAVGPYIGASGAG